MLKLKFDKFLRNNVVMFFGAGLGSFFNLLYQLIMLRLVEPGVFASLNSLLSLLTIISVPATAFTNMVTKSISSRRALNEVEQLKAIWQKLTGHAFIFSLGAFVIVILFNRGLTDFLQLQSSSSIIILGGILFLWGMTPIINGGLTGLEKFAWLAGITALTSLLKLVLSFALVRNLSSQLDAALLGFLASVLFGIALSLFPLGFLLKGRVAYRGDLRKLYVYILPVLFVTTCVAVLTNIDMLLVKHFFLKESQDYALAQMIGKIVYFASGIVPSVMFPRTAGLHALNGDSRYILKRSLLFSFLSSFAVLLMYNLFPEFIMKLLVGSHNPETIILARILSLTMLLHALNNVLFYYQLSVENYKFIKLLVIVSCIEIVAMWLCHDTTFLVAGITLAASMLIFVLNVLSAFSARIVKSPSHLPV